MSELKNCPFCDAEMKFYRESSGGNKVIGSHTDECPLQGTNFITWSSNDAAPIINKWNTRADGWISVDSATPNGDCQVIVKTSSTKVRD